MGRTDSQTIELSPPDVGYDVDILRGVGSKYERPMYFKALLIRFCSHSGIHVLTLRPVLVVLTWHSPPS